VLPHEIAQSFPETSNSKRHWWDNMFCKETSKQMTDIKLLRKIRSERNLKSCSQHSHSDDCDPVSSSSCNIENACNEALVCQICLEPYEVGDKIALSKYNRLCDHAFHQKCITSWLRRNNTCPCCRHRYIDTEQLESDAKKCSFKHFFTKKETADKSSEPWQFSQIHGVIYPSRKKEEENDLDRSKTISTKSIEYEASSELGDCKTESMRSTADLSV
jgi:hypothetical protein